MFLFIGVGGFGVLVGVVVGVVVGVGEVGWILRNEVSILCSVFGLVFFVSSVVSIDGKWLLIFFNVSFVSSVVCDILLWLLW